MPSPCEFCRNTCTSLLWCDTLRADVRMSKLTGGKIMRGLLKWFLAIAFTFIAADVHAEVVALQILKREPFAGGREFGAVGAYDQITAIARFAIDPKVERNRFITDLDLAPRNADGKVEFLSDVVILVPKDV